jgi:diketogulonate reductase-like aldo/keto reductase
VRRSVAESIARLGSIPDLLLIHNPSVPEPGRIGEFWTHLEALIKDGTLAGCSLGISNFRPQDIEEVMKVATIPPVCHRKSAIAPLTQNSSTTPTSWPISRPSSPSTQSTGLWRRRTGR